MIADLHALTGSLKLLGGAGVPVVAIMVMIKLSQLTERQLESADAVLSMGVSPRVLRHTYTKTVFGAVSVALVGAGLWLGVGALGVAEIANYRL